MKRHSLTLVDERAPFCFSRIDPKKDTLFLPDRAYGHDQTPLIRGKLWSREVFKSLRFMALEYIIWENCSRSVDFYYINFTMYESLEELTIIVHHDRMKCSQRWPTPITRITFHKHFDEDRFVNFRMEAVAALEEQKEENQAEEWEIPKVEIRYIRRGGGKGSICCEANESEDEDEDEGDDED
jgi:hypothetical protein